MCRTDALIKNGPIPVRPYKFLYKPKKKKKYVDFVALKPNRSFNTCVR